MYKCPSETFIGFQIVLVSLEVPGHLIDNELRITAYVLVQGSHVMTELYTHYQSFILANVVGCLEFESKCIFI